MHFITQNKFTIQIFKFKIIYGCSVSFYILIYIADFKFIVHPLKNILTKYLINNTF